MRKGPVLLTTLSVVVTPPVEIDLMTAPSLQAAILEAQTRKPRRIVVDFAGVRFCDSYGLAALASARLEVRANGIVLDIRSPSPLLQRVATMLGVADELGLPQAAG